jgi:Bacterial membrane protein YfhO
VTARARSAIALVLLALLPALAHAPAWLSGQLLAPGDGAALHYPLKVATWRAWRAGELPGWNPAIFGGTPLLAAYRPAALHPLVVALAPLDNFIAFQGLVLLSLSASAMLVFLYLRRLGAESVGAYVAGLCFALGPYLVGHLDDTATILAAPTLPLLLLAAESHLNRPGRARALGLALAVTLNLLSGSPEAARAGLALLAGRLLIAHLPFGGTSPTPKRLSLLAVATGVLLAAPQLLPTLLAAGEAGRQATGFASAQVAGPMGLAGLILRYVSHTPAAGLALAALPLALRLTPVRVLGVALAIALGLQAGRGPLSAPGASSLVFDFTLCVLAGLSLSEQWRLRRDPAGDRLRAWLLASSLASAAALSLAAAALGPLPQSLASAVGVLAIAQILFFATIQAPSVVTAGVWLLPLSVSLLLQPHSREIWRDAPTRSALYSGSPTSLAVERGLDTNPGQRLLTLVRDWPQGDEVDLGYANWADLRGRITANGYDPMVPLRNRLALDGMGPAGTLPGGFFRGDPARLELLGIRWVQAPARALAVQADAQGLGETLDVVVENGRPHVFPLPTRLASEVRVASWLSEAVDVPDETPVALVHVRLATGRELPLVLRAGRETSEWAYERSDVRPHVRHARAQVLESWPVDGGSFLGHRYLATLSLPGRYLLNGLVVERLPGPGKLTIARLGVRDGAGGGIGVSVVSSFVSDTHHFRETVATPGVRLFELPAAVPRVHVAAHVRAFDSREALVQAVRAPASVGLRVADEVLALRADVTGLDIHAPGSPGPTPTHVLATHSEPGHWDLRAEGPGVLVVGDGWDRGWSARVDDAPAPVLRVNDVQLGVPLALGMHRVKLDYHPRGFGLGVVLAALAALGFAASTTRRSWSAG